MSPQVSWLFFKAVRAGLAVKRPYLSHTGRASNAEKQPTGRGPEGCVQNGPSARREEGAYLNRYVTDEQRSRRPIFNATLRAAASWLFFCVARSTRMTQIWALRSRLEKQPTDLRRRHYYMRDGTLVRLSFASEQVSPEFVYNA